MLSSFYISPQQYIISSRRNQTLANEILENGNGLCEQNIITGIHEEEEEEDWRFRKYISQLFGFTKQNIHEYWPLLFLAECIQLIYPNNMLNILWDFLFTSDCDIVQLSY